MGKHLIRIMKQERGFSLIEVLVAAGIGVAVLSFAGSEIRRSMELKRLVTKHDIIGNLEEKIRRAVKDPVSMERSGKGDKKLESCLQADKDNCETSGGDFDLVSVSGGTDGNIVQTLTGSYNGSGASCTAGCPLKVETSFKAVCRGSVATCDVGETIVVSYRILVDEHVFRSGVVTIVNPVDGAGDDNLACGLDERNLPKFANHVSQATMSCLPLPVGARRLTGVNPGSCVMGKEVMVGFDPGTKEIICVPAKFSSGK